MKKAVIFDMDGVLVDSYRAHWESWVRLCRRHGLEMTEQQFATTFGRTSRDIIGLFWADRVAPADYAALDAEKEANYRQILHEHFPEMPGASDLIRRLHDAGFAMAVGSSGPPENVQAVLDCLRNAQFITATVNGMEVTHGKPHPDIFLKAAGHLGVEPGRCAVVEDAPAGVEAALRAGMTAIARVGTVTRDQLAAAHLTVNSLDEISPQAVQDLIGANAFNVRRHVGPVNMRLTSDGTSDL